MSPVDHLARARDYLARGEEFYARAADEIIAAQKEDPQLGQREIAERLGRGVRWVNTLVQWRTSVSDPEHPPFGGPAENEARYDRQARTALKDPDRRRKALAGLDTREVEQVARDAHTEVIGRARAQRREQVTEPTVGELESQVEIQAVNVQRCRDRLDADRRVLAFLRAKEGELGRPVTAGEFAEEIAALIGEPQEQAA